MKVARGTDWMMRGGDRSPAHLEQALHLTVEMPPLGFLIMVLPHQAKCPLDEATSPGQGKQGSLGGRGKHHPEGL